MRNIFKDDLPMCVLKCHHVTVIYTVLQLEWLSGVELR